MGAYERGRIWVGGLLPECEDQDLRAYFVQFGDVREATVARETATNLSRGFGFIKMGSQVLVDKALKEQHQIWENSIQVKLAAEVTIDPEKLPVEEPVAQDSAKDADQPPEADPELEAEIRQAEDFLAGQSERDKQSDSNDYWSKDGVGSKIDYSKSKNGQTDSNVGWGDHASEDRRSAGGYGGWGSDRGGRSQPYDRSGGSIGGAGGYSCKGNYGGGSSDGSQHQQQTDSSDWRSKDGGSYGGSRGSSHGGSDNSSSDGGRWSKHQKNSGGGGYGASSGGYGSGRDRGQPYGRSGGGDDHGDSRASSWGDQGGSWNAGRRWSDQ